MPVHYKPTKFAIKSELPSITEQEHKESCDINRMIKRALKGAQIRGSATDPIYGDDDMNYDSITHHTLKQNVTAQFKKILTEDGMSHEDIQKIKPSELHTEALKAHSKKLKKSTEQKTAQKTNDNLNDDKTKADIKSVETKTQTGSSGTV